MSKSFSRILKIVSTVLIVIVVLLACLLVGVRIFGLKVYTVLSPSMEPSYPTGSLIYVRGVDTGELQEKDVITFYLSGSTTATHRIVEVITEEDGTRSFRTKGDHNESEDHSLVREEEVIGKVVFCIPYLGYLATGIQSPPGLYIAIAVAAAIILLVILADQLSDGRPNQGKNKENKKLEEKEGKS